MNKIFFSMSPEALKEVQRLTQKLKIKEPERKTPQKGCSTSLIAILNPNLPRKSSQVSFMDSSQLMTVHRRRWRLSMRLQALEGGFRM